MYKYLEIKIYFFACWYLYSEEKGEEAERCNSERELDKDWVISRGASNARCSYVGLDNECIWGGTDGLVEAILNGGSVASGSIDILAWGHGSTAESSISRWAHGHIGSSAGSTDGGIQSWSACNKECNG